MLGAYALGTNAIAGNYIPLKIDDKGFSATLIAKKLATPRKTKKRNENDEALILFIL